jgi:hypothetical protein
MKRFVFAGLLAALLLAACAPAAAPTESHEDEHGAGVHVHNVWGRVSPMVADTGAFYMILHNEADEVDRLVSAETAACQTVEIHETVEGANGMMEMRPLTNGLELPAGTDVELKPGGLHIMCIGKTVDFAAGAKISLKLNFEHAEPLTVEAEIREE